MKADSEVRVFRVLATAAMCLTIAAGSFAQTTFGPDEMREAAVAALRSGDATTARRFGEALW